MCSTAPAEGCAGSFRVGSPIESSPIVQRAARLLRCLERARLRARPRAPPACAGLATLGAKITSSASLADRTLYIGDYASEGLGSRPGTGRTRWVAQRERPHLRDAGRLQRPRLRPLVDRRLAHRVLDARPLPLARRPARTCTRRRRSGAGASSSAPTTASSTASRLRAAACSGASARAGRSRGRRSSSTASPTQAASRTTSCGSQPGAAACSSLSARSLRPSFRGRNAPVLHGYSRLYAVEPVRRAADRSGRRTPSLGSHVTLRRTPAPWFPWHS